MLATVVPIQYNDSLDLDRKRENFEKVVKS
jgi:hypothetical protein